MNVRIIRHNFVGDKAKIRRRAVALQGFLTQSPAKFDEKTCMNPYVDRFSVPLEDHIQRKLLVFAVYLHHAAVLLYDFLYIFHTEAMKSLVGF